MAIVTICNHKGGTGKTTTVIHVAAALGLGGHKTLAIDLDPQGFLTRTLGIEEPPEESSSLALFTSGTRLTEVPALQIGAFHLIPSSSALTKLMRSLNKPTDVLWLREILQDPHDYDFVLLDTAAAVTAYSLNALVACNYAIIPVTPEYQPVVGAEQTYQTCMLVRDKLNPDLNPPFFLLTRVDGRKRSHSLYKTYLRRTYERAVMKTVIRTSTSLSDTYADGQTVFDRDSSSRGAVDYANATDEILSLVVPNPGREGPASAVGDLEPRAEAV